MATTTQRADWSRRIHKLAEEYGQPNATTGAQELPAYAWPGGYPIVYVDGNTDSVCPSCANKPNDSKIFDYFIHYEGEPEVCAVCGAEIPSAYGDPDAEESSDAT